MFNKTQLKLLADFCSDIAKGAVLSGLGLAFILPNNTTERFFYTVPAMFAAILFLLLALIFARLFVD